MNTPQRAYCSLEHKETKKQVSGCVNAAIGTCLKVIGKLFRSYFEFMFTGKEDHLHAGPVRTRIIKRIDE